jgi:Ser/Thr protein kinase RdoA (MazF antagonist)
MVMDHGEAGEERLAGGNASASVVRVGSTVRKPWLATTERTVAYMIALRERGVDLPEPHGRDDQGRLVLDFVPGRLAMDDAPLDVDLVRAVGAVVRSIHDASAGLPFGDDWAVLLPARWPDLLCHNDLATWNLVVDGDRLVFIDWDGAGPSTRLWDLAYAATSFGHLFPDSSIRDSAARLAAFVDGYGASPDLRAALPEAMARRASAMHELLRESHDAGREPWGSMYTAGHGEHWLATTEFVTRHELAWRRALTSARHS